MWITGRPRYLHVVHVSLQDLRPWVDVFLYEPVLHCCVGSYIFHGADWLTDWLRLHAWPQPAHIHSTPLCLAAPPLSIHTNTAAEPLPSRLSPHRLPPPPLPPLHSLNNPYSYSISDEWERERAKQLTPAPSATPRFDVWGDSIVIDPEEGGGYGTATLIRQRRA